VQLVKKLVAAILIVLIVGVGLLIWQVWDAKATASAQALAQDQAVLAAQQAAQQHKIFNTDLGMAQLMWPPWKVDMYRHCLEFKEQFGKFIPGECEELDKAVQHQYAKVAAMVDAAIAERNAKKQRSK